MGILRTLGIVTAIIALLPPIIYQSFDHRYIILRLLHKGLTLNYQYNPYIQHRLQNDNRSISHEYRAFEDIFKMRPVAKSSSITDNVERAKQLRKEFIFQSLVPKSYGCNVEKHTFNYEGNTTTGYFVYSNKQLQRYDDNKDQDIIIWLHGGGYMLGDINGYSGYECELSKRSNTTVLHIEYSLVPESPLPIAVDEVINVYKLLLDQNYNLYKHVIIGGDSAGGGLTLLVLQRIIADKLPIPKAAVTYSPWSDLTSSGASYKHNADIDIMLKIDRVPWAIEQVFGGKQRMKELNIDPSNPIYSPAFGSFHKFPPLLLHVGTAEILHSEGLDVYNKAKKANVDVTLYEGHHLCHVYPLFYNYSPEASNALDHVVQWIKQQFNR